MSNFPTRNILRFNHEEIVPTTVTAPPGTAFYRLAVKPVSF